MPISGIGSSYPDSSGVSAYPSATAVESGSNAAVAQQEANVVLTEDSSVIAALSGGSGSAALTYAPTGLLSGNLSVDTNLASDPYASLQANGSNSDSVLQDAVDKEIVATLSAKSIGAGVYNATGVLESLPFSRVTDLGSLLRYNPNLSSILIGNSYNQGIIESLNIIA